MKCFNCQKITNNPRFCSRSCAASYNNNLNPKRKPEGKCKICGNSIIRQRTYCKNCRKPFNKDMTLKEAIYTQHHKSSAFSLVRLRARAVGRKQGWAACAMCGYDKHFEICHIKSIADFSETALLSEINNIGNLIPLCPNHHWELDHGLIHPHWEFNGQLKLIIK